MRSTLVMRKLASQREYIYRKVFLSTSLKESRFSFHVGMEDSPGCSYFLRQPPVCSHRSKQGVDMYRGTIHRCPHITDYIHIWRRANRIELCNRTVAAVPDLDFVQKMRVQLG
jgi:hypothetical protein